MTVLLVIITVSILIIIDIIYKRKKAEERVSSRESTGISEAEIKKYGLQEIQIPQSVFFGKGHTWLKIRPSGNVQIGIDDFASKFIGKITKISTFPVGMELKKGELLFTINQDGKKLSFASPVSGTIYSINDTVLDNPEIIKSNPFEHSWFCTIKPKNLSIELKLLKIADEASSWIKGEMIKLKDFIAGINIENSLIGATLHDGGEPTIGVMQYLDDKACDKFQKEFLSE
jgi:glycine cleavage system H protein